MAQRSDALTYLECKHEGAPVHLGRREAAHCRIAAPADDRGEEARDDVVLELRGESEGASWGGSGKSTNVKAREAEE